MDYASFLMNINHTRQFLKSNAVMHHLKIEQQTQMDKNKINTKGPNSEFELILIFFSGEMKNSIIAIATKTKAKKQEARNT